MEQKLHDDSNLKKNFCEECKKNFSSSNFKVHLRTHENTRPYICSFCKWSFRQYCHLQRHIENVHKNGEKIATLRDKFECKECNKFYTTFQKLISHDLLVHQKSEFLTCQLCNKHHVDLDGLLQHYKLDHSNAVCLKDGRLYACSEDGCDATFQSLPALRQHQTDHDDEERGVSETECEQLEATTTSKALFVEEHGKAEKLPFSKSDEVFSDDKKQFMHQREKNFVTDIPCQNCSKRFIDVESLVLHTVRCHWSSGSSCVKCGKAYAKVSAARKHLRFLQCPVFRRELEGAGVKLSDVIPSLEKSTCSICSVSFANVKALDIHMRKHSGEKPHTCNECGKCFSQSGNLKTHIESIHEGKKKVNDSSVQKRQFKCSICKKSFSSAVDLKAHTRVHSGDKPYKCEHCGREFSQKGNLNTHIRRWHTDPNKKNKKDPATFSTKKLPFPSDENIGIGQFQISRNKIQENPEQSQSPGFMYTKFKTADLIPSKQTLVLPSLITTSITNLDFKGTGNKPVLQYFQHFSAVPSTTVITSIPNLSTFESSSCLNDTSVENKGVINQQGNRFISHQRGKKALMVDEQETFICQEANVICGESSSDETVHFSLINDTPTTASLTNDSAIKSLINDSPETSWIKDSPEAGKEVTHGGRLPYSCEETTVITDSNASFEIIDDSLKENTNTLEQVMNMHGSTFICKEANVISSTSDSLGATNETVDNNRNIINEQVALENNPYICKEMNVITALQAPFDETTYNPFEESSINCERYIEQESNPLNCQEVNVISCLNTPFEPTHTQVGLTENENIYIEENSQLCKETNVIIADATTQCENFKHIFTTTGCVNISGNSNPDKNPICKETNVITGLNSNAPNISLMNNCSSVKEVINVQQHPYLCMETNVITVVHKPREIVSPSHVSTVEKLFEKKTVSFSENFASKEYGNDNDECIIQDLTKDYDINAVKHSSGCRETKNCDINVMCKETNVIKGILSTFETASSYIEDNNATFDKEMFDIGNDPYACQETNVIIGLNSPIDSVTANSGMKHHFETNDEICQGTNVIPSVYSAFKSVDASVLEEETQVGKEFNEIPLTCQETHVITSLDLPVESTSSVINDVASCDNSICKETNVITIASLPFETRNSTIKDTVTLQQFDVEQNRNICQVTNVITGVSVPHQTTSASCKDNIVDDKPFDIIDYSPYNCKQTNVIRDTMTSQKDSTNKELIEMTGNPYICQVTNVITSISLPIQTTNASLRDTSISGSDNCAAERSFNSMNSNFINAVNSPFETTNSFEPSPSFESIEEELVPYENIQNQPIFLVLEQTKDLESINFNALCQGLFPSVPTTSTKTQVIVNNNNLFNENFFISPNLLLEESEQMQTNNVSDGCVTLSDVEVEFTDINWCQNYQIPSLTNKLGTIPVNSLATVIKNVSGGEVKDVGLSEPPSNLMCSSDKELMDCDHLQDDT